ncbi:class I glutamine amidotransferase-like protein [Gymnopilus junonius]|uniref:Class I glutamine amidotransferase-like protein n=1 Tax=Gymnopilus junonius TaxID=109634 RepID=A0A9P5NXU7_GYMJU|nr:class I glutamine amidotransferase-like protein [Gymnopilus junonius]
MSKLALFLCGDLAGPALERNGSYLDIYTAYLHNSCPTTHPPSSPSIHLLPACSIHISHTPTAANAYDNIDWINNLVAYVARIASSKPHIKLIGICFGHQIIARALGGECVPNNGRWEVGPTQITLTQLGKSIFGPRDTLTIQEMHRDHVPSVPPNADLHVLASTELSPNQGMVKFYPAAQDTETHAHGNGTVQAASKKVQIFTIQGHPEFTQRVISDIVEQRSAVGVMSAQISDDLKSRLDKGWDKEAQNDSNDVVGKVIWDIIEGKI